MATILLSGSVGQVRFLHPPTEEPAGSIVPKKQAYYIDQVSREPLTDPYTLETGGRVSRTTSALGNRC